MPIQKMDPQVMARLQYMAKNDKESFNALTDLGAFHGFTPGDDMTKAIKSQQSALDQESGLRPGAESLMRDHINALTNLQNILYKGQDTRGASIFDPPAGPDDSQPYGATLGNPQGVQGNGNQ